jgi:hypothetical protein
VGKRAVVRATLDNGGMIVRDRTGTAEEEIGDLRTSWFPSFSISAFSFAAVHHLYVRLPAREF